MSAALATRILSCGECAGDEKSDDSEMGALEERECKDEKRRSKEVRTCTGGENVIRKTEVDMRRRLGNIVAPLTKARFIIIMLQW